jgi:hypothetical protein
MYVCRAQTTWEGQTTYLLVVAHKLASLVGDLVEDIHDEGVHDGHALGGDTRVRVHLLQHLVDVDGVGLWNSQGKRVSAGILAIVPQSTSLLFLTVPILLKKHETSRLAAPTLAGPHKNKKWCKDKVPGTQEPMEARTQHQSWRMRLKCAVAAILCPVRSTCPRRSCCNAASRCQAKCV